ncbi:MAG TPA: nicotinamide-nucleotide amidohydrolase family protein [Exilispira sp.]|nr:nicotinamide-nucleotide amidohydrolase family protein [Exilispira sp.]
MKAAIFVIGSEIIDGKTIDTNSLYLNLFLLKYGIKVEKKIILNDDKFAIKNSINKELNDFDFFFFIGGLGPTFDDITIDSISETFDLNILIDEDQVKKIKEFIHLRKISDQKLIELNLRQARYIGNKLENSKGWALGSFFQIKKNEKEKYFFLLPGPKVEFETMLNDKVSTILSKISNYHHYTKNIYVYNIAESSLNNLLKSLHLKTLYGIYAKEHLKIVTFQSDSIELINEDLEKLRNYKNLLGYCIKKLDETPNNYCNNNFVFNRKIIEKKNFFTDRDLIITDEIDFKNLFFEFLMKKNLKFSAAESCSGGILSSSITSIPSSSDYFLGSVVCYSAYSKEKVLKTNKKIIEKYGTVSPQITRILAKNNKKIFNSDFSISITGFAGPTGGNDIYPIGTCFIGITYNNNNELDLTYYKKNDNLKTVIYRCNFKGNRSTVQNLSVIFSMFLAIYNLYD